MAPPRRGLHGLHRVHDQQDLSQILIFLYCELRYLECLLTSPTMFMITSTVAAGAI